jgi:hypothetical protein
MIGFGYGKMGGLDGMVPPERIRGYFLKLILTKNNRISQHYIDK